jgi:hypothetical protein
VAKYLRGTQVKQNVLKRRQKENNYFYTLKMKAACSSETLTTVYQTALCHITKDIIFKEHVMIVQDQTGFNSNNISPKIWPCILKLLMFSRDCGTCGSGLLRIETSWNAVLKIVINLQVP